MHALRCICILIMMMKITFHTYDAFVWGCWFTNYKSFVRACLQKFVNKSAYRNIRSLGLKSLLLPRNILCIKQRLTVYWLSLLNISYFLTVSFCFCKSVLRFTIEFWVWLASIKHACRKILVQEFREKSKV